MSAGRTYTVLFRSVAITAAQDLCAAYAGANMALEVVSFTIGQDTQNSVELVPISIKLLTSAVTAGSGGSAFTPEPDTDTDAAATFTARINDTTIATGGATHYKHADMWNLVNGYPWIFPERARPSCKPGEALIFSLDGAPAASRTTSASFKLRELF
jgi:hypothetical protein